MTVHSHADIEGQHHNIEAMRSLWAHVLEATIRDYKQRIQAAKRRERFASINGASEMISDLETEVLYARLYFDSADAREVMELAGYGYQPERIIKYLTDAADMPVKERDRSIVSMFLDGVSVKELAVAFGVPPHRVAAVVGAAQ